MRRLARYAVPLVLAVALAAAGCDGDSDTSDPNPTSDTGSPADATADDTTTASDADAGAPGDGEAADSSGDVGDTGIEKPELDGGAVQLVHRPPKCSISTQTCSLTVSPDMQTGLKAQVLRDGEGVQGETVVFEITSGSDLASIDPTEQPTDPMGRAGTELNTGSDTGEFRVEARVQFRDADPISWDVTIE